MYTFIDEDEFETVVTSRPCTGCNGDRTKCHGQCNGAFWLGSRRRLPSEIKAIKAARLTARENAILAEADAIRARRL